MLPFQFSKARAETLIDAIQNGKAIEPPPGGWNSLDLLQTAGAFFFAAMSRGPAMYAMDKEKFAGLHQEHRELEGDQFLNELHSGIQFQSNLTVAVVDGEYDENYEPEVAGALSWDDEKRSATVHPVKGFK